MGKHRSSRSPKDWGKIEKRKELFRPYAEAAELVGCHIDRVTPNCMAAVYNKEQPEEIYFVPINLKCRPEDFARNLVAGQRLSYCI
ncbi:MAG: hypothetical protein PHX43_08360 [Alphaproteobacteria bacterium]|nr:hypothetical protein [Alphaproteobacteria bacterium]